MNFPLSIKKNIVLDRAELQVSSEKYIINHIAEYMTQFGMKEQRRAENELFYLNMIPIKTLDRKRFVRNLSIKVEVTSTQIIITIESAVILLFIATVLTFVTPFFLPAADGKIFIPILGSTFYLINYSINVLIINSYKSEIEQVVRSLK
jgi:hypothetical protein